MCIGLELLVPNPGQKRFIDFHKQFK
jgi:hypothetical protein